jgi:hypothetical protein
MYKFSNYATAPGQPNDRRKTARFQVAGTAWCGWVAVDGHRESWGTTNNIGMAGVFVESDTPPPVGTAVTLVVVLRTNRQTGITVCLRGAGDVRHVQQGPFQASGYGASVVFHTIAPESAGVSKHVQ